MIRVFLSGRHAHRTPLSYPALSSLFTHEISFTKTFDTADMFLFAHVLDVQDAPFALMQSWRKRQRPVVILSEEPFWDTIWGQRPLDAMIYVDTQWGSLPVHQINHATSTLFHFAHIPYYLLTDHRFANAYTHCFARNAAQSRDAWQEAFAARARDVVFMFERRPEPYHLVRWEAGDITGLCSWRTELAETMTKAMGTRVECLGHSWQGGRTRFELDDWHIDKLVRLDNHAQIIGAIENTHQPHYITEKVFDAFACGSIPAYYASPGHRIHEIGLPSEAWINLYDMTPEAAANALATAQPNPEAFRAAQIQLHALFGQPDRWMAERSRVADATVKALKDILA